MISQYNIPTRIFMGEGCVLAKAAELAPLGKKALIVTGHSSAVKSGALADIKAALDANGQEYAIYDSVMSNPTVECVYEGAEKAKSIGADFIIGIGGGSPMDAAKAIALLACQDIPRERLFDGNYDEKILPMAMVPTTAGTGSEATQYSIITNDARKTKTSISSPFMFPTLAYLDSRYLRAVPRNTAVNTAIDAFSHCVEGYLSVRANPITDALAREGMEAISSVFPRLAKGSLTDADRDKLLYASTIGGMVIAHTGTTAVHPMGYSLTYFKGADHGRANGLLLGAFLKSIENRCPERIGDIMTAIGMSGADELSRVLDTLLGGEERREKVTKDEAAYYASVAIKAKNIKNCIVTLTEAELYEIYLKSFGIKV